MKLHFLQNANGGVTYSNWPVKENGVESKPFEVTEEDLKAVEEGSKEWVVTDNSLSTIPSTRKEEREQFLAEVKQVEEQKAAELEILKTKLSEGKASLSEIQLALSKLI